MSKRLILSLLAISLIAVLGTSFAAAQDIPEGIDAAWWSSAAEAYAGTTLRGVSESTPPSNYVRDVLAPMFTSLTGINVELETTSWLSLIHI